MSNHFDDNNKVGVLSPRTLDLLQAPNSRPKVGTLEHDPLKIDKFHRPQIIDQFKFNQSSSTTILSAQIVAGDNNGNVTALSVKKGESGVRQLFLSHDIQHHVAQADLFQN